jgi:hypothetical protein
MAKRALTTNIRRHAAEKWVMKCCEGEKHTINLKEPTEACKAV